jgi:DNA repair exonuclease SbcCD ATPase subunit
MPLWTTIANSYIVATKDAELKPPEDLSTYMLENECSFHVQEITSSTVQLCAKGPREKLKTFLGPLDLFEVCVNGLQWREVSISLKEDTTDESLYQQENVCLNLNIETLVPSTANEIAVINPNCPDQGVLFHATICTIQKEATAAPIAPQHVRPSSPISTLTDKLNNAIDNLNDLKNNQRRIRKDHKSNVTSLRAEIDLLHSRLEAPEKGEERARRGNLALKYHNMQTEDKIRALEEEIRQAEKSNSDRQEELISSREKWGSERSALESSRRSQNATKLSYDKFLQQFHAEKLTINARKEKLTSREVKLKGELEILQAAEQKRDEECGDRSKKRQEARAQLIKERQASQAEQIVVVEQMDGQLAEIKDRIARTNVERQLLESMPVVQPSPVIPSPSAPSPLVGGYEGLRRSATPEEKGQGSLGVQAL